MTNDPIADFLTQIRNAIQRNKKQVEMPSTRVIEAIANILKQEGFIADYKIEGNPLQNRIVVSLRYVNSVPAIRKLIRVSKAGVRYYMGYRDIPRVKNGLGIAIFSTPKGIMTGKQAKDAQVGGEYLCKVW